MKKIMVKFSVMTVFLCLIILGCGSGGGREEEGFPDFSNAYSNGDFVWSKDECVKCKQKYIYYGYNGNWINKGDRYFTDKPCKESNDGLHYLVHHTKTYAVWGGEWHLLSESTPGAPHPVGHEKHVDSEKNELISNSQENKNHSNKNIDSSVNSSDKQEIFKHQIGNVSLGNVGIGTTVDDVQKRMGQAREVTHSDDAKKTYYKYADIDLTIMNGKVIGFVSNTSKLATPHGISQGDSLKKVLSVYGDPYAKSEYDGTTLYEYKLIGLENIPCILRFAIKDSKVDYISGRIFDN